MTEAEMRSHRCCFTGHRPDKLIRSKEQITKDLTAAIDIAISDGYRTFISGMAMGVDIWAAQIVLEKKTVLRSLFFCALLSSLPAAGAARTAAAAARAAFFARAQQTAQREECPCGQQREKKPIQNSHSSSPPI